MGSTSKRREPSAFSRGEAMKFPGTPLVQRYRHALAPHRFDRPFHFAPIRDGLGYDIPAGRSMRDERLASLMRLIGRLYTVDSPFVFPLIYAPDFSYMTLHRDLQDLHQQRFVWKASLERHLVYPDRKGGEPVKIYGITHEAKNVLRELGIESTDQALRDLKARSSSTIVIPKPSTINHDLQASWWSISMVDALHLIPWCCGISVQAEYIVSDDQRIDSLITARFNRNKFRDDLARIPWVSSDDPLEEGEFEFRWALELDNGSESLKVLRGKFAAYRDHHVGGLYKKKLRGNVLPVLVVQDRARAVRLGQEFRKIWPNGFGVIATVAWTVNDDVPFGVLWGNYYNMNTKEIVPLLSKVVSDIANSGGMDVGIFFPHKLWMFIVHHVIAGTLPQRFDDAFEMFNATNL